MCEVTDGRRNVSVNYYFARNYTHLQSSFIYVPRLVLSLLRCIERNWNGADTRLPAPEVRGDAPEDVRLGHHGLPHFAVAGNNLRGHSKDTLECDEMRCERMAKGPRDLNDTL